MAVPAAIFAAFLSFEAFAWACTPPAGSTTVNPTSGDPGESVMASATGVTSAGVSYVLKYADSQANCHHSVQIGGPTTSTGSFTIPNTNGVIPGNASPGIRWVCFARQSDATNFSLPTAFTVL